MAALSVEQVMERFVMSRETVLQMFRRHDSPAYKIGPNPKSPWRVDEDDFKKYMQELAKTSKG